MDRLLKDMEEVEKIVKWAELQFPRDVVDDLRFLLGLYPNEGVSKLVELNGAEVPVDASIADGVYRINQAGYRTLACCSGIVEEHRGAKYARTCGYLALAYDERLLSALILEAERLGIVAEESETYLQRSIRIAVNGETDKVIREKWDALFCFLERISERSGRNGPIPSEAGL